LVLDGEYFFSRAITAETCRRASKQGDKLVLCALWTVLVWAILILLCF